MFDVSSKLNQEDALKYVIELLKWKEGNAQDTRHGIEYGYDIYLPNVMRKWCKVNYGQFGIANEHQSDQLLPAVSPYFYNACWELCRLGVLRPGIHEWGAQSTDDGSAGNGYSLTPFGKQWLSEEDESVFVPTEPQRFATMIAAYAKFGPGFQERANQAIRCYGAHTYLACCVMCGAAAESILLHLAITKEGNEPGVLKKYRASNGRKAIENTILGSQKGGVKNDFEACFNLLKYWRDEAAHGRKSDIKESEAFTSLALLLRSAQFAMDNYESLTGKKL